MIDDIELEAQAHAKYVPWWPRWRTYDAAAQGPHLHTLSSAKAVAQGGRDVEATEEALAELRAHMGSRLDSLRGVRSAAAAFRGTYTGLRSAAAPRGTYVGLRLCARNVLVADTLRFSLRSPAAVCAPLQDDRTPELGSARVHGRSGREERWCERCAGHGASAARHRVIAAGVASSLRGAAQNSLFARF